jgi:TATA-binding protein-associated factor Taf7
MVEMRRKRKKKIKKRNFNGHMDVGFEFNRLNNGFLYLRILVTPPLKNVRKRRFRKVARQKTQDHDEIEKEVRRLFR